MRSRLPYPSLAASRLRTPPSWRSPVPDTIPGSSAPSPECGVHVCAIFGARLYELNAQALRELLAHLRGHRPRIDHVDLVPDEQRLHGRRRVPLDVAQPVLHILERLRVRHVVDHDDAVRAAVVLRRDGAEALLPRRVPDLQLHALAVQVQRADLEVHADGADVLVRVRVFRVPQHEAALPHVHVADEQNLEQVVILDAVQRVHGGPLGASPAGLPPSTAPGSARAPPYLRPPPP
eukprot:CAMPEP_0118879552 /NCGR_PEP_ID=MMETSP1163-20130328/19295_1 /TAXON_ID=124430 /ORGANISM="Phaeomonas parva, Strain CCMP2877" /LENGTH=234 /DNA_ID=CAMNT_0006815739 /DNA_START=120 /DNA_END=822 /DNA_ORIENTATION=-